MRDVSDWPIMKMPPIDPVTQAIQEEIKLYAKTGKLSDGREVNVN
mgnify:CR=1 FL=1